jgi:hypothetical protein
VVILIEKEQLAKDAWLLCPGFHQKILGSDPGSTINIHSLRSFSATQQYSHPGQPGIGTPRAIDVLSR